MAVPIPYVPIAGDNATQARVLTWVDAINYQLGNATSGGAKKPLAVMTQSIAQSIPNNAFTSVSFNLELVDYDNGHSTSVNTSRYTAQTAGWHWVSGSCGFVGNATGARDIQFAVNGTAYSTSETGWATVPNGGNMGMVAPNPPVYLNAGDYLELQVFQTSGGALNTLIGGAANPQMSVLFVSN